ncbi:hypothetical protein WJX81_004678 [Elliptochloris bilobata]|uniref:Ubiquitin-like domain-containing protein n=1 Tax=Elliptochloris bilobata TaxID=381761 RepID=A0AAW1RCU2_9CHLO
MVQILVHIRPADRPGAPHFELLECRKETSIGEIKAMARLTQSELVFMGERCLDERCLCDYGISEDFVSQVAGFVVNPDRPGKRFVDGVLVSY